MPCQAKKTSRNVICFPGFHRADKDFQREQFRIERMEQRLKADGNFTHRDLCPGPAPSRSFEQAHLPGEAQPQGVPVAASEAVESLPGAPSRGGPRPASSPRSGGPQRCGGGTGGAGGGGGGCGGGGGGGGWGGGGGGPPPGGGGPRGSRVPGSVAPRRAAPGWSGPPAPKRG